MSALLTDAEMQTLTTLADRAGIVITAEHLSRAAEERKALERRRLAFFRSERLSAPERAWFPLDFDPGPEFDTQ